MRSYIVERRPLHPVALPTGAPNLRVVIEEVYVFDWDRFTKSDWETLQNAYEAMPKWRG